MIWIIDFVVEKVKMEEDMVLKGFTYFLTKNNELFDNSKISLASSSSCKK